MNPRRKEILALKDVTDNLFRNVGNELPLTLRNIPEERRYYLLRGGSLKSHTKILFTWEIFPFTLLDCCLVKIC
jgi:hypothetical protein